MVLRVRNFSKRITSDAENAPPLAKTLSHSSTTSVITTVTRTIRDASRRRRARTTGTTNSHHPRLIVEQAKRRTQVKSAATPPTTVTFEIPAVRDVEMVDVKPEEEKVKSVMSVGLPRFLKKPEFKAVESEVIEGIDEGLKGVDVEFVRDCLEEVGPRMMQVLASVQAEPIRNALPKELSIIINDLSADLPTHMFAVYARQPSPPSSSSDAPRRRVTLFPIHNIVMASHCANLPRLSTEKPKTPEKVGEEVTVPVVPLCIPSPQTFPQLSAYLYTKRSDHLLASLLPCPPPQPFVFSSSSSSSPSDSPESHDAKLLAYAKKLAGTYTPNALLQHAMLINGLWRNVCALGVDEERLWCTLDLAWEVVLRAMALATGVEFA